MPFTSAPGADPEARQSTIEIFEAARATAHRYTAYSKSHQKTGTVLDVKQDGPTVVHASVINIDLLPESYGSMVQSRPTLTSPQQQLKQQPRLPPPTQPQHTTAKEAPSMVVTAVDSPEECCRDSLSPGPAVRPVPVQEETATSPEENQKQNEKEEEEEEEEEDLKSQPMESLVNTLRGEIDILNIFIDDVMVQLKEKDDKLARAEQKYADLKKEHDRLLSRNEKENNGLQKNCHVSPDAANPGKDETAPTGTSSNNSLPLSVISPNRDISASSQPPVRSKAQEGKKASVPRTKVPRDTNLPMSFREHAKKKMLVGTAERLSQVRRSVGCDNLANEFGKKRLIKSTSTAWVMRGGRGKQPTQVDEPGCCARKASAGSGYKSARESPCTRRRPRAEDGPDSAIECSLGDSCGDSRHEIDKKDYSISSIEQELLKQIGKMPAGCMDQSNSMEQSSGEEQIKELITRCPYIDQLRQTSEKYRTVIMMLKALAVSRAD